MGWSHFRPVIELKLQVFPVEYGSENSPHFWTTEKMQKKWEKYIAPHAISFGRTKVRFEEI